MQNAFQDVPFQHGLLPANDAGDVFTALIQSIKHLSDEQITALEDELDLFAFTGLIGHLMGRILDTTPTVGETSFPSKFQDF